MKRSAFIKLVVGAAATLASVATLADNFPSRPIRIVVPFAAGGAADIVARLMGAEMSKTLGVPVIVDPRPGAGANIAGTIVAKSPADGYTLLMGALNNFSINQFLFRDMPYDPFGFTWLTIAIDIPQIIVVNAKLPVHSLKELVEYAKTNRVDLASQGVGTTTQISLELLNQAGGVKIQHIPYKGANDLVPAIIGEQVQMAIGGYLNLGAHIRNGQLRALAITSKGRLPLLPNVPTTAEAGYPSVAITNWFGLTAPKGMNPEISQRIYDAAVRSLRVPSVQKSIEDQGLTVVANSPGDMEKEVRTSADLFRRIIETMAIDKQ